MLLESNHCPKNVSKEHYELCQIARYILYQKGYKIIGQEIVLHKHGEYLNNFKQFNDHKYSKSTIDIVGLNLKGIYYSYSDWKNPKNKELLYQEPTFKSIGIEAKVSLADFKNGFCTPCEKTYIIAPKGVIPKELILKNIGLIEVDLSNYSIKRVREDFIFKGVEETIKAKINLDPCFITRDKPLNNKEYQTFCKDILRFIGYRYSVDKVFKEYEIDVKIKK